VESGASSLGSHLPHVTGVRSVTGSGGRIGNNDIFEFVLGDSADGEGVCGGGLVVAVAWNEQRQMRRTNTNSEAKDSQTGQGILDNVRLAGTVESGGGPVVFVVVRRLGDPAMASIRELVWKSVCSAYFPIGISA